MVRRGGRATGPLPPAPPGRGAGRRGAWRRATALLAAPAFVWYLVFLVGPLVSVFVFSLTDASTLIAPRRFTGLDNFRTVLTDDVFWTSAKNTAIQVGVVVPVMVVLGFMLGYYLFLRPPLAGLLRILFFTSALLSVATKAMIFYAILAPDGLVNQGLGGLGLGGLRENWLANPDTVLPVIMATDLWAGVGFLAVLFSAQLTALPTEVIDASRLDGCGNWRTMWHVAFGMIRGFVGVVAMLQYLWTLFLSATTVLLLTRGGPGTSSFTLSFLVWSKAFQQSDIGYSQAVGVILFAVGLAGAVLIRFSLRSKT
jgi:multiple sugar transport system permease protein